MTTPHITEIPQRLARVTEDPFIDDLVLPSRPPAEAGRPPTSDGTEPGRLTALARLAFAPPGLSHQGLDGPGSGTP